MPWSVAYLKEDDIVLITNEGSLTYDDYKQQTSEAWKIAREHETPSILVDDAELDNRAELLDVFDFPNYYTTIGVERHIRIALLVPEHKMTTGFTFYENVCRNRGWNVRIFPERQAAVTWLKNRKELS